MPLPVPAVMAVALVALGIYFAKPICPVDSESLYQHVREQLLRGGTPQSSARPFVDGSMSVVELINNSAGPARDLYQKCIGGRASGLFDREPEIFTLEEFCLVSIVLASTEWGLKRGLFPK
jgi:hypothetical protein